MKQSAPLLLMILDGWGYSECVADNAIIQAKTPVWDQLWANYPHTLLQASGSAVGLPAGQMGNSEVGHSIIGAGRILQSELVRINQQIANGDFFTNSVLLAGLEQVRQRQAKLHCVSLLSAGGVHSHEQHLYALLQLASQQQISNVVIHAFLDGRDTAPQSARQNLLSLLEVCENLQCGQIASLCGRYYAMDRDQRLDRTAACCDLLTTGRAAYVAADPIAGLELAYQRGETDEFVQPTKIAQAMIEDGDVVIFSNFRADRARQISYALTKQISLGQFITFTEYAADLGAKVVFPRQNLANVLGECCQQHAISQLRIAETEKYSHVTSFFNAGREVPFVGEDRILIPSPQVSSYDLQPAMSASLISEKLCSALLDNKYGFLVCNYANADMVGHTGNFLATKRAIEELDLNIGQVLSTVLEVGGAALITADHGNAEQMFNSQQQQPHTAHTNNQVPCLYVSTAQQYNLRVGGSLQDIAPTVMELLQLPVPDEMTGSSLLCGIDS